MTNQPAQSFLRQTSDNPSVRVLGGAVLLFFALGLPAQTLPSVTLAWNASLSPAIAGYRLYQGQASETYSLTNDLGNITNTTVSGLTVGATYFFAVTAYDINGLESLPSSEISYTVANPTNSSPPPTNSSPAPTLVAAYGFEEGTGSTLSDASGHGNLGTLNGATWTTGGRFGNALSFDGSSAAVIVNDSSSLDLTAGMTLEAWVYPTSVTGWHEVIYKGNDLYFLEGSTSVTTGPAVGLGDTGSNPMLSSATGLPLNTWSHLAATYDGATLRLFVNGVQVGAFARTGPIGTSTLPLSIGADTVHGSYFAGLIDEVRIYNGPVSASQIQTDMKTPVAALPLPWQAADIGSTGMAGSAAASSGLYTVAGAGNISGTADNFRFVYQLLSGDGDFKAQLTSQQSTNPAARAGVMLRESLTPGSRYVLMGLLPGRAFQWQRRSKTASNTSSMASGTGTMPNTWIRVARSGTGFTGYSSADGTNWTLIGSSSINMAANIYAGFAVASGTTNALNSATFTNVSLIP
ncbi:MAG TPA: LamG-like jellyroll fold domain-containing protein [Candidatus Binatia bacterium]|nr:LamG-like jellyroll fold domain-containing protein [Candidatus Binatia bacterium]